MGHKGKKRELAIYERLVECSSGEAEGEQAPRGFVPVIVGKDPNVERFLVHVKLFKDPCMVVLLEMAEDELGHKQEDLVPSIVITTEPSIEAPLLTGSKPIIVDAPFAKGAKEVIPPTVIGNPEVPMPQILNDRRLSEKTLKKGKGITGASQSQVVITEEKVGITIEELTSTLNTEEPDSIVVISEEEVEEAVRDFSLAISREKGVNLINEE
ncbi:hypothetical protein J5N97_028414 [Dioscorea zingiberensis]|uniref:Uncharacterized protein n=1 Tax=Dioscorea zingiberensis TaxID=325984 RepID=A0A9D5BYF4_9LILI|nr:hypothetical protein J5N97_028414 [Dioscorea zingiberensis]